MDSLPCDIVLLPSETLAERAIALSAKLQQPSALFQLSSTGPYPHVSLYMVQLKASNLDSVQDILKNIAATTPALRLTGSGYGRAEGYIDIDYKRTGFLERLQMTVVNAVSPVRDGLRENDRARLPTATGKVRENLETYGYRGVGELFRPHMTLTRFADSQPIDDKSLPPAGECSGEFIKFGLFAMGPNGTCARKIAEFDLQPRR